jgi:hypothetical protein
MRHEMTIHIAWDKPSSEGGGPSMPERQFIRSRNMSFREVEDQIRAVLKATMVPRGTNDALDWEVLPADLLIVGLKMNPLIRDLDAVIPTGEVWVASVSAAGGGRMIRMAVFDHGEFTGHLASIQTFLDKDRTDAIVNALRTAFENGQNGVNLDPDHGGALFQVKTWPPFHPLIEGDTSSLPG